MSFLFRELLGWALAALGMVMIGLVVMLAINRSVLEAIAVSFPATIVFRAGIGFVRMAVAGRIAAAITQPGPRG